MSVAVHVMCLLYLSCSNKSRNASIDFGTNRKQSTTKVFCVFPYGKLDEHGKGGTQLRFGVEVKKRLFVPQFADEQTSICHRVTERLTCDPVRRKTF